jgi:hypothetical protein
VKAERWRSPTDIARQTTKNEEKGTSREKAEINALMENAILAIFRDFPDAFLLFGGARSSYFTKASDTLRISIYVHGELRYRHATK